MASSVERRKVWSTPTTRLSCSNASGSKFTILSGHVEEFFSIVDTLVVKIQFEKLCDGPEIAIFASCICSEPHAAHFRPVS